MPTVKYMWGTAFGTDIVDCDVLDKKDDKFLIRFFDDVIEEVTQRWTDRSSLIFPKFADTIVG